MRTLSSTLLAAQTQPSRSPFVEVKISNRQMGITKLNWTRLYTGSEPEGPHALTMPADGSLIRVRVTPAEDGQKLYRQRVTNPGPASDFTQWTYTGVYSILAVAACSLGSEVSLFWVDGDCRLKRQNSTDNGANWSSPEILDYTTSTAVYGLAAAYKPNGDLAVFFTDQNTLFVKLYTGGQWQAKTGWDKTTGDLSGVSVVYNGDWCILLTGVDSNDNPELWSMVYGDGEEVTSGEWSDLKIIASAPAAEHFTFGCPMLEKPDVYRGCYLERYSGIEASSRPYGIHSIPDSIYLENMWHEPAPFDYTGEYGLAMTHSSNYCWLTGPSGVWRASSAVENLDLANDVVSISGELTENSGKLLVELDNSRGKYALPGSGVIALLQAGNQLDFSPGYHTAAGNETSPGLSYMLEGYEHIVTGKKGTIILQSCDGWTALQHWHARCQFRWNKEPEEMSVRQILEFVLARAGLKLEVKSASDTINDFYPDFTIHPGNSGTAVINKLLSFVPDVILIEGYRAYLVNPQASDSPVYAYGTDHPILEGKYSHNAEELNRIQIEGLDTETGTTLLSDTFDWDEIKKSGERWKQITDSNVISIAIAQSRGSAYLRAAEIHAVNDCIRVSVNCGQQMFDPVSVTENLAGLSAAKRRVIGIQLLFSPEHGRYEQELRLGAV